uniref:Uncharacterized protein n=1 Tax=Setaria digitata TaxID=48799 RepID=A0A915PZH9_9BILA
MSRFGEFSGTGEQDGVGMIVSRVPSELWLAGKLSSQMVEFSGATTSNPPQQNQKPASVSAHFTFTYLVLPTDNILP